MALRICCHSRGSPAATRVTSRTPWPDSDRWAAGASASAPAISAATTWGTWEVRATAASCSSGLKKNGVAPHRVGQLDHDGLSASRDDVSWLVTAHGRPSKSRAEAARGPDRSLPANGWEPT